MSGRSGVLTWSSWVYNQSKCGQGVIHTRENRKRALAKGLLQDVAYKDGYLLQKVWGEVALVQSFPWNVRVPQL